MDGGNNGRQPDQQAGWVFKPGGSTPSPDSDHEPSQQSSVALAPIGDSVEWTASEYVAHEKGRSWYAQVMVAATILAVLVYLITRDVVSTIVVVFAGLVFAAAAARKPRVVAYRVDTTGLTVGQKYYPFNQFKSYAVMQQGPLATVIFMPLKRFVPTVDIYIPPENAEAILTILSNSLPLETRKQGLVDTFTNRIRF